MSSPRKRRSRKKLFKLRGCRSHDDGDGDDDDDDDDDDDI